MPHYDTKQSVDSGYNIYRNMYQDTTKRYSSAFNLLLKWRGSCFRLIGHEILTWAILYGILSFIYHQILFTEPKSRHMQMFEMICIYAERFGAMVPITFLIGFYVTQVVNRWWDEFMSLPWPDYLAIKLVNFCPGTVSEQVGYF